MLHNLAERLVRRLPWRYQRVARQFIKFGITGTIGATVDFTTYNLLFRGLGLTAFYTALGLNFTIANNISVFLAIMSNFILNKYWTFRDPSKQVGRQWVGYFTLNTFTWFLNQVLVAVFTTLPLMTALFGSQRDNAAKALAIGLILSINFLGSKFLIFKKATVLPAQS
jgi:putative flippase GtrA